MREICTSVGSAVITGLTCARQLQRRGFDVTIYAMTVPPNTTSNMSLAGFTPTTALVNNERRTPAWDAQFVRAADEVLSLAGYTLMLANTGVAVSTVIAVTATASVNWRAENCRPA